MALHLNTESHQKLFTGYGAGYVAINGHIVRQAVVITPTEVRTDWLATDFATLTAEHFNYFMELKPEVLLFGTGKTQQFARPELFRELLQARIAVEFMDTPAACRTYNILAAEDRNVAAAILL